MDGKEEKSPAMLTWTYVPPVIIIFGTFGNILTIVTLAGNKLKSYSVYLIALAVADLLVLYTQTFNLWLELVLEIRIKDSATFSCKLYYFLIFLCPQISSWLVVCLTTERTICTYFPTRVRQFPGPRIGLTAVGVIVCVLCALNAHAFYGRQLGILPNEKMASCGFISDEYKRFYHNYWTLINFTTYLAMPLVVIIFGNATTAFKVYMSARAVVASTTSSTFRARVRHVFLLTIMVSTAFIVLVTPLPLLFVVTPVDMLQFPAAVFADMVALNHAINFFFYFLSGRQFRDDLKVVLRRLAEKIYKRRTAVSMNTNISVITETINEEHVQI